MMDDRPEGVRRRGRERDGEGANDAPPTAAAVTEELGGRGGATSEGKEAPGTTRGADG